MRILLRLDLLLVLQVAALAGCASGERNAASAARRVVLESRGGVAARPRISAAAERLDVRALMSVRLENWSSESVEAVREAASAAAFYAAAPQARMVLIERRFVEEKLRRGPPSERDLKRLFKDYLAARMFDPAKAMRSRFPGVPFPSMPDEIVASTEMPRAVYAVGLDWRRVELIPGPELGSSVVVAMYPGCPAAEAATRDLLADSRTAAILRNLSILLTERFDAEGVAAWKKTFGLRRFYIARRPADFPEISFDASPTFYFLKDGVVKSTMTGWGGDAGAEENRRMWLAEYERAGR